MMRENYIVLSGERGRGKCAVIDYGDVARVLSVSMRWHLTSKGYAACCKWNPSDKRPFSVKMHRLVLGSLSGVSQVDHANRDKLDNRNINLRDSTSQGNNANRTGFSKRNTFKGAHKHRNRWQATIRVNGKQHHLGTFDNEVDAATAYDIAARKNFGAFACCNFSESFTSQEETS